MTKLSKCPEPLPHGLDEELKKIASLWANHCDRPRLSPIAAAHWDKVITEWANDPTLPLLIRKSQKGVARGEVIIHESGRALVLTDNSPANWSYISAISGEQPSLSDIHLELTQDLIPIAMVVDREMKAHSKYKCCRVNAASPNSLGWKVCHKKKVGLGGRGKLEIRPLELLKDHFIRFLSPSNIFLVPKALGGLGEVEHFIEAVRSEL